MRARRIAVGVVALTGACLAILSALVLRTYIQDNRDIEFVLAAGNGDLSAVRSRLALGVVPDHPRWKGLTACEYAAFKGRSSVVTLLLQHGADPQAGLYEAILTKNRREVRLFLRNGADPFRRDARHEESPIEFAERIADPETVQVLRPR